MYKGMDLINKPIVTHDQGKVIGNVKDVLFNAVNNKILGLLLDEAGLISSAQVIPFVKISSIGQDSIIVQGEDAVIKAQDDAAIAETLSGENIARGTKIMTDDGKDMGAISDIFLDEESGTIDGYEVSGGMFADAYSGKTFLPAPKSFRIGKDVAFIPNETAALMEEQVGGIKKVMQTVDEKVGEMKYVAEEQRENTQDSTMAAAKYAEDTKAAHAKEASKSDLVAATVDQTLGRKVKQIVRTKNGGLIAASGQIVTQAVIDRAKKSNEETELLEAVNMTKEQAVSEKAESVSSDVGNVLQVGVAKVANIASNAWETIKNNASELKDEANDTIETKRIESVLGKPANRVILDKQDKKILDVGELITHESIAKARVAGVLNILLSSAGDATTSKAMGDAANNEEDKNSGNNSITASNVKSAEVDIKGGY